MGFALRADRPTGLWEYLADRLPEISGRLVDRRAIGKPDSAGLKVDQDGAYV